MKISDKLKALEIIKTKQVDVYMFRLFATLVAVDLKTKKKLN